ncbi:unnamed protein product [Amoebophrya sp. A120]|nr:unnamed protein product [Amoebophrya sp. A120]|eukprot:GSA120T00017997001.1
MKNKFLKKSPDRGKGKPTTVSTAASTTDRSTDHGQNENTASSGFGCQGSASNGGCARYNARADEAVGAITKSPAFEHDRAHDDLLLVYEDFLVDIQGVDQSTANKSRCAQMHQPKGSEHSRQPELEPLLLFSPRNTTSRSNKIKPEKNIGTEDERRRSTERLGPGTTEAVEQGTQEVPHPRVLELVEQDPALYCVAMDEFGVAHTMRAAGFASNSVGREHSPRSYNTIIPTMDGAAQALNADVADASQVLRSPCVGAVFLDLADAASTDQAADRDPTGVLDHRIVMPTAGGRERNQQRQTRRPQQHFFCDADSWMHFVTRPVPVSHIICPLQGRAGPGALEVKYAKRRFLEGRIRALQKSQVVSPSNAGQAGDGVLDLDSEKAKAAGSAIVVDSRGTVRGAISCEVRRLELVLASLNLACSSSCPHQHESSTGETLSSSLREEQKAAAEEDKGCEKMAKVKDNTTAGKVQMKKMQQGNFLFRPCSRTRRISSLRRSNDDENAAFDNSNTNTFGEGQLCKSFSLISATSRAKRQRGVLQLKKAFRQMQLRGAGRYNYHARLQVELAQQKNQSRAKLSPSWASASSSRNVLTRTRIHLQSCLQSPQEQNIRGAVTLASKDSVIRKEHNNINEISIARRTSMLLNISGTSIPTLTVDGRVGILPGLAQDLDHARKNKTTWRNSSPRAGAAPVCNYEEQEDVLDHDEQASRRARSQQEKLRAAYLEGFRRRYLPFLRPDVEQYHVRDFAGMWAPTAVAQTKKSTAFRARALRKAALAGTSMHCVGRGGATSSAATTRMKHDQAASSPSFTLSCCMEDISLDQDQEVTGNIKSGMTLPPSISRGTAAAGAPTAKTVPTSSLLETVFVLDDRSGSILDVQWVQKRRTIGLGATAFPFRRCGTGASHPFETTGRRRIFPSELVVFALEGQASLNGYAHEVLPDSCRLRIAHRKRQWRAYCRKLVEKRMIPARRPPAARGERTGHHQQENYFIEDERSNVDVVAKHTVGPREEIFQKDALVLGSFPFQLTAPDSSTKNTQQQEQQLPSRIFVMDLPSGAVVSSRFATARTITPNVQYRKKQFLAAREDHQKSHGPQDTTAGPGRLLQIADRFHDHRSRTSARSSSCCLSLRPNKNDTWSESVEEEDRWSSAFAFAS